MTDLQENQAKINRRTAFSLPGVGAVALSLTAIAGANVPATPAAAQTQDGTGGKLRQVLERGKLLVGTGSTNPPWHFEDATGTLVGMDIDMGHLLAKGLFGDPQKVEFVLQGADARIPNLLTDKVDIVIQFMTVNAERAQQVDFTVPYYREGVGLMLLADSSYQTYEELKAAGSKITVPVLQNAFVEEWVHKALPEAVVQQFESVDAATQAFLAKRGDVMANDQSAIAWHLQNEPGKFRTVDFGWNPNSYAAAVRQGDQTWLNFVNTALKEAMIGIEFDFYSASFKKWFGKAPPAPAIGFPAEFT